MQRATAPETPFGVAKNYLREPHIPKPRLV